MANKSSQTDKDVQVLIDCPTCKGNGKIPLQIWEKGIHREGHVTCINCDGVGKVEAEEQRLKEEAAERFWCSCRRSGGATSVDRGVSKVCHEHHWICNDCKKVIQIG